MCIGVSSQIAALTKAASKNVIQARRFIVRFLYLYAIELAVRQRRQIDMDFIARTDLACHADDTHDP